jgi:hypothetical protein
MSDGHKEYLVAAAKHKKLAWKHVVAVVAPHLSRRRRGMDGAEP